MTSAMRIPTDEEIHEFYSGEREAGVPFELLRQFGVWWGRRMSEPVAVPPQIEAAIRGRTFTRQQANRIIDLVNMCVAPEDRG